MKMKMNRLTLFVLLFWISPSFSVTNNSQQPVTNQLSSLLKQHQRTILVAAGVSLISCISAIKFIRFFAHPDIKAAQKLMANNQSWMNFRKNKPLHPLTDTIVNSILELITKKYEAVVYPPDTIPLIAFDPLLHGFEPSIEGINNEIRILEKYLSQIQATPCWKRLFFGITGASMSKAKKGIERLQSLKKIAYEPSLNFSIPPNFNESIS